MSAHADTAEHAVVSPPPELTDEPTRTRPRARRVPRVEWRSKPRSRPAAGSPAVRNATALGTVAVAGLLCLATFLGGGGLHLARMTTLELILTLAGGAIVLAAVALAAPDARRYGAWPIALLLAFTALSALSVTWSVAADSSWQDANRLLAYSWVFAAAVTVVWVLPSGWRALLGGVVLAAVVVCTYALLTKVLPDRLDAADAYARLQQPYGYWNALGLTAAMGAVGCLWLGARRAGHALLTALAYPAMGLMLVTVMLVYSRGALAALAIGAIAWIALVPLRLRGVRVLAVAALAAGPVVAWDFSKPALKDEAVALAARTTAGHQLGVLLAAMLVVLALAGVAIGFFGDRSAPRRNTRRAVGAAIAAVVVLAVLGAIGGLAASKRGLSGTVSHNLSLLTNPNARVPNTSARLTDVSNVRARYWKEAIEVFEAHPALGAGAGGYQVARLRYRTLPIDVRQAHGYVVQTLADLGLIGLGLTLVLLLAWLGAAGRATRPFNRRWRVRRSPPGMAWERLSDAYTPERVGLLTMACIVGTFGVHSFVDWTWYIPGDALVALLCAGWVAGRGPLPAGDPLAPAGSPAAAEAPTASADFAPVPSHASATSAADDGSLGAAGAVRREPRGRGRREPGRVAAAVVVVAVALLAAWSEWQPQRSVDASEQALALLRGNPVAALSAAQAGVQRDPLSAIALFHLAAVQSDTGQGALARASLQQAVKLQPSNPETWVQLGEYDLHRNPRAAVQELRAAVYLDPQSVQTQNLYVLALRAAPAAAKSAEGARANGSHAGRSSGHAARGGGARGGGGAQKRLRRALPSSTRRAPGTPPAPRTSTSRKPKSASKQASTRRV